MKGGARRARRQPFCASSQGDPRLVRRSARSPIRIGSVLMPHTDAVDNDVTDLVEPVARFQSPIDFDRRTALWANDLTRHDDTLGIQSAAGHLEGLAAILSQSMTANAGDIILEESPRGYCAARNESPSQDRLYSRASILVPPSSGASRGRNDPNSILGGCSSANQVHSLEPSDRRGALCQVRTTWG